MSRVSDQMLSLGEAEKDKATWWSDKTYSGEVCSGEECFIRHEMSNKWKVIGLILIARRARCRETFVMFSAFSWLGMFQFCFSKNCSCVWPSCRHVGLVISGCSMQRRFQVEAFWASLQEGVGSCGIAMESVGPQPCGCPHIGVVRCGLSLWDKLKICNLDETSHHFIKTPEARSVLLSLISDVCSCSICYHFISKLQHILNLQSQHFFSAQFLFTGHDNS